MKILVTGGAGFIPLFYKPFKECGFQTTGFRGTLTGKVWVIR